MQKHFIAGALIGVAVLLCSSAASAQTASGEKPIGNKTKATLPSHLPGSRPILLRVRRRGRRLARWGRRRWRLLGPRGSPAFRKAEGGSRSAA